MYAIEFETDIKDRFIEVREYEKLVNKHAKVIIMVSEQSEIIDNKDAKQAEEARLLKIFSDARGSKIDPSIDIDQLCNEINNDRLF